MRWSLLLLVPMLMGFTVPFMWPPHPAPDLKGYKIYHGMKDQPKELVATLSRDVTHFAYTTDVVGEHCWDLTAFDWAGVEGPHSDEVCAILDPDQPVKHVLEFE